jgi:EAL and modified HD-GYP domain-containing signal transduction protein
MDDKPPLAFARQPIVDSQGCVKAYEILERGALASAETRTARALLFSLVDRPGIVPEGIPRFINVPPALLQEPLPPAEGSVVLEVLEDAVPSPALADALAAQRAQGYALALDDYALAPEWTPYFDQFAYLKLEVPRLRLQQNWTLPALPPSAQWIGEKVETAATLRALEARGVSLFQGYFFAFPELTRPEPLPQWSSTVLQLLGALERPEVDFRALARIAGADPTLTVRLLRAAGAVAYGPPVRSLTLPDAIARLGLKALKRWLQLMLLADAGTFSEVKLRWALERACLAAALAPREGLRADEAYLLGLLSGADVLFNRPLAEVLAGLPLEIDAILGAREGRGPGGALLATVARLQENAPLRPEEQAAYGAGCAEADALYAVLKAEGAPP